MMNVNSPRFRVVGLIVLLYTIVWFAVGYPLWVYVGTMESVLGNVIMALIALFALLGSFSKLRPAAMTLSIFNGDMDKLDATKGSKTGKGLLGTHFVLNFPKQLTEVYVIPVSAFSVSFKSIKANTKSVPVMDAEGNSTDEFTPVETWAGAIVKLPVNLEKIRRVIENIDFLSHSPGYDLTEIEKIKFYRSKGNGLSIEEYTQDCFCISSVFTHLLQGTIDQALSQAINMHTLDEALGNKQTIENTFYGQLRAGTNEDGSKREDTIIALAGFLEKDSDCFFDLNLVDILIADQDTATAISSATKERYNARGAVEKALGEKKATTIRSEGVAASIKNRAKAIEDGGEAAIQALAAQAIVDAAPNATFVAGLGLLDSAAAALTQQTAKKNTPPPNNPT